MSWPWFSQAADTAWAKRKGLKVSWLSSPADARVLPMDNPTSNTKLSQAITSAMPSMLPHPCIHERRANERPPSAPYRTKQTAGPGSFAQTTRPPAVLVHSDQNQRLVPELHSAWTRARASVMNLQLRMVSLPSMAAAVRTLTQASTLTLQAHHFGANSKAAAMAIAKRCTYVEDKRWLQATPTTKPELLEEAEILAARSTDWEWKTLGGHVVVTRAGHGLPGPFGDGLMPADSLDTFWPAYVQFVVHVPDISTIRDTNDSLRINAWGHVVPN